jgi:hypothetical protein
VRIDRGLLPALVLGLAASGAAAERSHLVIVVGLGGEPQYTEAFRGLAVAMVGAAEKKLGIDSADIAYLGEKAEELGIAVYRGRSTRENVQKVLLGIARRAGPDDLVFILLIGHGSARADESRFNLPGPDMGAADFVPLLDALAAQRVVFVNTASASGDFVKVLGGERRTVVTATRSALERNETAFARYFVEAFAGDGADADKDERVSVQEAFDYARREVERSYEKSRRLLTEHAVLGDAEGRARGLFLGAGQEEGGGDTADSQLAALRGERRDAEKKLEALRAQKATMEAAAYQEELERLLLELALKDEAIRQRQGEAKTREATR